MSPRIPIKGSKNLRKGRSSEKGAFYFVTTCCHKNQRLFADEANANIFLDSVDWLVNKRYIDLHFCIAMPDHIHLVFQLTSNKTLSEIMESLKQFTSCKIKRNLAIKHAIWQQQYYDHLIRNEDSLTKIIKYCWLNPVRAGLVNNSKNYPYFKSKYELG